MWCPPFRLSAHFPKIKQQSAGSALATNTGMSVITAHGRRRRMVLVLALFAYVPGMALASEKSVVITASPIRVKRGFPFPSRIGATLSFTGRKADALAARQQVQDEASRWRITAKPVFTFGFGKRRTMLLKLSERRGGIGDFNLSRMDAFVNHVVTAPGK